MAESLHKKASDKEKRKRKTQEKANAMMTRLASHRLNPEAAPNSEAAKEAASIARFEHGTSVLSSASSSSSASNNFPNDGDIAFVAHYQRLDTEGIDEETEFRLRFAEEEDEEEDEEFF